MGRNVRECGACNVCCVVPEIPDLGKMAGDPCPHLCGNCTIYDKRPRMCREYECAWLEGHGENRDRPDTTGILTAGKDTQFGLVLVATGAPALTRAGKRSLERLAADANLPCLVVDPKTERVERVYGPVEDMLAANPGLRIRPDGAIKRVRI